MRQLRIPVEGRVCQMLECRLLSEPETRAGLGSSPRPHPWLCGLRLASRSPAPLEVAEDRGPALQKRAVSKHQTRTCADARDGSVCGTDVPSAAFRSGGWRAGGASASPRSLESGGFLPRPQGSCFN